MSGVVEIFRVLKEFLRVDITIILMFQFILLYVTFYALKYCIEEDHYFLGLFIVNAIAIFEIYLFLM